jgi:hypothetical protein
MKCLVIPSNREHCLWTFFNEWEGRGGWDTVIVVEDGPKKTFSVPKGTHHYSWAEIDSTLGSDARIISKKDSAILCFGLLVAWHLGADSVLTLSDDCYPDSEQANLYKAHEQALKHPRWISTVPGLRVRGLPYRNTGTLEAVANVGLWREHPDLDAVSAFWLMSEGASPRYELPNRNWIVPHGQVVPVCEMNLFLKREAIPLFYFPKMGEGSPYRRFDDIWAGIIAKRLMDHLGYHLSVGEPFVRHMRASDPYVNVVKEAPGLALNESLWEPVLKADLTHDYHLNAVHELGEELACEAPAYVKELGRALQTWSRLLVKDLKV